jgi:hypothetical protein
MSYTKRGDTLLQSNEEDKMHISVIISRSRALEEHKLKTV